MNLCIENGLVFDNATEHGRVATVYIRDGQIESIGETPKNFKADRTIDANGCWLSTGFVDLGFFLTEPGNEQKGTIASEGKAALAGGFTTLLGLPSTLPSIDSTAVVQWVLDKAEDVQQAKLYPIGSMTKDMAGQQLSEMHALKKAGCIALAHISDAMPNGQVLRRAMQYASSLQLPLILCAQDHALAASGCVHEGENNARLGLPGLSVSAETVALAQIIELVVDTGCHVHVHGLSSARSVAMLARAQYDQLPITADVHANHLLFTEKNIGTFDANFHVQPPLRSEEDRLALIDGVKKGVLNVSSGHQPHEIEAKQAPFPATQAGVSSVQSAISVLSMLVQSGELEPHHVINSMTSPPAALLMDGTQMETGAKANITIINPSKTWLVDEASWHSAGLNTPFMGKTLTGQVTHTLMDGQVVYEA